MAFIFLRYLPPKIEFAAEGWNQYLVYLIIFYNFSTSEMGDLETIGMNNVMLCMKNFRIKIVCQRTGREKKPLSKLIEK